MPNAIMPRRAAHLQPGDVVKLSPQDAGRRVLWVAPDRRAPVFIVGTWRDASGHVDTFRCNFHRFFTVERTA